MNIRIVAAALVTCALGVQPALAAAYQAAPTVAARATSDAAASVESQMDVAAPPKVVWATLVDCANATRFMPKLISCKILQKGPGDRWEVREHVLKGNMLKPKMRNVFRADFSPPHRLAFRRVAGDWKRSEGVWTITPIDGGRGSHVAYHTDVALNGPVPVSMVRAAVLKGMPEAMLALRRECVSRAGAKPSR